MSSLYPYQAAQSDQCSQTPLLHDLHLNWGYKKITIHICPALVFAVWPIPSPASCSFLFAAKLPGPHCVSVPARVQHQRDLPCLPLPLEQRNSPVQQHFWFYYHTTQLHCHHAFSWGSPFPIYPQLGCVGGFFVPFFSLSVPLSCGKAQHMPQSLVCWRKTSVLIYYMNIWLSPRLPRLLKMVHFTVVTLHS